MIVLAHVQFTPKPQDIERIEWARRSWDFHVRAGAIREVAIKTEDFLTFRQLADAARTACVFRDDVIVIANSDDGLTVDAPARIGGGIVIGRGVTALPRHVLAKAPFDEDVSALPVDGGVGIMAMTVYWWEQNRSKMPDVYVGKEATENVFCTLAEEWADGRPCEVPAFFRGQPSRAYTLGAAWHISHESEWMKTRTTDPINLHNRNAARRFFQERGNAFMVRQFQDPGPEGALRAIAAVLDEHGDQV